MKFVERQARLEKKTCEAIDELEDVFNVEIPTYPEVRWLGRLGHFEDLGLPEYYRDEVECLQAQRCSVLMSKSKVIILNRDCPEHINEETSHFVHTEASGIHYKNKDPEDLIHLHALVEMFGYLGSKLLDPSRKNSFKDFPDYFSIACRHRLGFNKFAGILNDITGGDVSERLIHSQGYGLAERVFCALETGQTNIRYFQKLIRQNFNGSGEATKTFKDLRHEFWPY
jgi:hypothetical protein